MSHYAKIVNGKVEQVIVAEEDFINSGAVGDPSMWIQTSYNNNFRKCYAGIGFHYDKTNDVFYAPKPFDSWRLNSKFDWEPPVIMPTDGKLYNWDEKNLKWIEFKL